uniref:Uncharacterized protein n=1 Tax=Anguilla anguilla TaxID=7936 RepID=A0A0E9VN75_ANGAN
MNVQRSLVYISTQPTAGLKGGNTCFMYSS